eukprot:JZ550297.1.p1 GENE.JZ550297.1~~JZ550297.1.p1  ORF type:complete len:174 (+),score=3.46 JZ550297.1:86-607(+)
MSTLQTRQPAPEEENGVPAVSMDAGSVQCSECYSDVSKVAPGPDGVRVFSMPCGHSVCAGCVSAIRSFPYTCTVCAEKFHFRDLIPNKPLGDLAVWCANVSAHKQSHIDRCDGRGCTKEARWRCAKCNQTLCDDCSTLVHRILSHDDAIEPLTPEGGSDRGVDLTPAVAPTPR